MSTIRELLAEAGDLGSDSSRLDAEVLLADGLQKPRSFLYAWPEQYVDAVVSQRYRDQLERRRRGEPIAYLIGRREFWSLSLHVDQHTLIPRPATELLVQWSLELDLPGEAVVMDLGTGSGAIALALASEKPTWRVYGSDISPGALAVARKNAQTHQFNKVTFVEGDWLSETEMMNFDLIVSNPPYIADGDVHLQQGDLRFEPQQALVSGAEGLDDIAVIAKQAAHHMANNGWLLIEHGATQGTSVRQLFLSAGFENISTREDADGLPRVTGGNWNGVPRDER